MPVAESKPAGFNLYNPYTFMRGEEVVEPQQEQLKDVEILENAQAASVPQLVVEEPPAEEAKKAIDPANLKVAKLRVQGLCCHKEIPIINQQLGKLKGIGNIQINVIGRMCNVEYDEKIVKLEEIISVMNEKHLGVSVQCSTTVAGGSKEPLLTRREKVEYAALIALTTGFCVLYSIKGAATLYTSYIVMCLVFGLALPTLLYKVYRSIAIRYTFDMNVLIFMSAACAFAVGDWSEAVLLVTLNSIGNKVEEACFSHVRNMLADLTFEKTDKAILAEPGRVGQMVPLDDITIGMKLSARTGDRIPVDGQIYKGNASVDESSLTGESAPIFVERGHKIRGGGIVQSGFIEFSATSSASQSTVGLVEALKASAGATTSNTGSLMDKIARFYTPAIVTLSIAVFAAGWFIEGNIRAAISVWLLRSCAIVVLACPCSLVLSAPLCTAFSVANAGRVGVVVKNSAALEMLGKLRMLGMDKTGTLTEGKFVVCDFIAFGDEVPRDLARMAAALEARSSHPIANAVVAYAIAGFGAGGCIGEAMAQMQGELGPVENFVERPGAGTIGYVKGNHIAVGSQAFIESLGIKISKNMQNRINTLQQEAKTLVIVAKNRQIAGLIGLRDRMRSNAGQVVNEIQSMGVHVTLVSGDNHNVCAVVQKELDIMACKSQCLPQEKLGWITQQQGFGNIVGMIGDGINDGPALKKSDVGIAMGASGAALSVDAADIVLMQDDLAMLPTTIRLAKKTYRTALGNVTFSLGVKGVAVALAIVGYLPLWCAIGIDIFTLSGVIAHSLFLLKPVARSSKQYEKMRLVCKPSEITPLLLPRSPAAQEGVFTRLGLRS